MQFRPDRVPLVLPGTMDLHQHDMTATFAADVPLRDAQANLAKIGQWLAVDGDPAASVGRLVEINSTGPLRLGFGAWRDLLLGCQFENAGGKLITVGGRTVKNVAGYDVTKLMIGQAGELGRLVSITLRTYRRPEQMLRIQTDATSHELQQMLISELRPHYAMLTRRGLTCGYFGDSVTLKHYADTLPLTGPELIHRRTVEEDSADRAASWVWGRDETFRAAVPPMRIIEFVEHAGLTDHWAADAAFGIVVGQAREAAHAALRAAAEAVGGSAYFVDAQGNMKWDIPAGLADTMTKLKAALGH